MSTELKKTRSPLLQSADNHLKRALIASLETGAVVVLSIYSFPAVALLSIITAPIIIGEAIAGIKDISKQVKITEQSRAQSSK